MSNIKEVHYKYNNEKIVLKGGRTITVKELVIKNKMSYLRYTDSAEKDQVIHEVDAYTFFKMKKKGFK